MFKKVGIASLIMMASVFLSRVIGLLREMAIAYAGGANLDVDAYQYAFILPEILNHILASGFLSITFIPVFSKYMSENREEEGWKVLSIILSSFGMLLILLIAASLIFTPQLIHLLAPGTDNPETIGKAIKMTRIILPAQFFFFAGGLFSAVQFAKERFTIPALAPLIYNTGIITLGLILSPRVGMEGFSWGVLAGAFAGNFLLQYMGARKCGMKLSLIIDFKHPELRRYIILTLPLMVGLTMTFSTELFPKFFGSYLAEGSISCFNYSLRIMLFLVAFFGQAIGVASYPFLSRLAADNNIKEMNRLLGGSLKYLAVIIPFSILFMILRQEIVLILLQRGRFDAHSADISANILLFLLAGSFAFAAQTVVTRGFYAMQNTLLPALFGSIAVVLSLPLYYFGSRLYGIYGIAAALTLSVTLQVIFLYIIWNRRTQNSGREVYLFFGKLTLISIPAGSAAYFSRQAISSIIAPHGAPGYLMVAALTGIVFLAVLLPTAWSLKIEEVQILVKKIAGKIIRKKQMDKGQG